MEPIKFSRNEENPLEVVRAIVFHALREGWWSQFPRTIESIQSIVEFEGDSSEAKHKFLLLTHEVLWDLILQRVLNPGSQSSNPELPFFRVTEYGKKVLAGGEMIPHDPANYLEKFTQILGQPDRVVIEYLKEGLRNFNAGCYLSANMMIGIASERTFLNLCEVFLNALIDQTEKKKFEKIMESNSMIAKFKFVQEKLESVMNQNRKMLPENTRTALFGIAELLRYQRNDIGHPQDDLQIPDRDLVFVNLRMFPQFCKTVQEVETFLRSNKI